MIREDAAHAPEVIEMGMRENHRGDGPLAEVLGNQVQGAPGGFASEQGVHHDPPGLAPDEGDVRDVETPHLVDAVNHLEEAMPGVELALAPEAGIDGRWRLALQEVVGTVVVHDPAGSVGDDPFRETGDEAPLGGGEIAVIARIGIRPGREGKAGDQSCQHGAGDALNHAGHG